MLSYTITAWKPDFCAFSNLSSKEHSPRIIKANFILSCVQLDAAAWRSGEQPSRGSATYRAPHIPFLATEPSRIKNPESISTTNFGLSKNKKEEEGEKLTKFSWEIGERGGYGIEDDGGDRKL